MQILSCQVYLGAVIGSNALSLSLHLSVLSAISIAGSALAFAAARSSRNMRLLWSLAVGIFIALLIIPVTPGIAHMTAWDILAVSAGAHYWFLPTLAFAWSVIFCIASRHQILQIIGGTLALLMVVGLLRDFRYPPFPDEQLAQYASRLDAMASGEILVIPEYPQGWNVRLVKR